VPKNYEAMSTFVKIMPKKLWPLFFRTWCTVCPTVRTACNVALQALYERYVNV